MEASERGVLRFDLLAEIAVGETARVELSRIADGPRAGELVAVKRLHPHIAADPAFATMFRDEVWMTAALRHTNVVEVVGYGEDELGPYLAVELVRGVSLLRLMKTVVETGEMFSERMVVFIGRSIADGLAAAHALRTPAGEHLELVHRDLTPGNVLLGVGGAVKIADFGLAKAKQRLTRTLTGLLKGDAHYMSPEQVRGEALDGRSDLFTLGVLLFELFAARRPWSSANELEAMRAVLEEPPLDLRSHRPRMDRALVEVVERCLEKEPSARYSSAAELRGRLDEWLNVHGYRDGNQEALARFLRRNALRQLRWFERAIAGEFGAAARADRAELAMLNRTETHVESDAPADANATVPRQVDWGEDGPTLVQASDAANAWAREVTRGRGRLPSIEATTERRAASHPRLDDAPSSLYPDTESERTRPVASRSSAPSSAPTSRADSTVTVVASQALASSPRGARETGALGIVAPPDPDAPPVPRAARSSAPPPAPPPPASTAPPLMHRLSAPPPPARHSSAPPEDNVPDTTIPVLTVPELRGRNAPQPAHVAPQAVLVSVAEAGELDALAFEARSMGQSAAHANVALRFASERAELLGRAAAALDEAVRLGQSGRIDEARLRWSDARRIDEELRHRQLGASGSHQRIEARSSRQLAMLDRRREKKQLVAFVVVVVFAVLLVSVFVVLFAM